MKDFLIQVLATLGYPIFQQGSLNENDPYPDSFFTFWNNDTPEGSHYDNEAINYVWDFDLNFYSIDPALVNTKLLEAKTLLKLNRFIVTGKGYDVGSDEPTHTGRGINAKIIEPKEQVTYIVTEDSNYLITEN